MILVEATHWPLVVVGAIPDSADSERSTVVDKPEDDRRSAAWAVYQCTNGCVHVRLQDVTLTFSPCEFAQLAQLVEEACTRLGLRPGVAAPRPH
jgi:hypothetical protein